DNLVVLTDPDGNKTTFTYDSRNRLMQEKDPLGNVTAYTHDVANELTALTDRNQRQIQFAYDDLGRQTTETWVGGGNVLHYGYDPAGNLLSTSDNNSALAFSYDRRNRIVTIDNAGTPNTPHVLLTQGFDLAGNRVSLLDSINGQADATEMMKYDD